jgi:hypothetical protein
MDLDKADYLSAASTYLKRSFSKQHAIMLYLLKVTCYQTMMETVLKDKRVENAIKKSE